jgi:hypothetical protein
MSVSSVVSVIAALDAVALEPVATPDVSSGGDSEPDHRAAQRVMSADPPDGLIVMRHEPVEPEIV